MNRARPLVPFATEIYHRSCDADGRVSEEKCPIRNVSLQTKSRQLKQLRQVTCNRPK
jgi:hypothetical protein